MKKIFAVCIVFVMMLGLTGCDDIINLSEEDQYLVAQYGAYLLLNNDKNFQKNLEYTTEEETSTEEETTESEDETSTDKDSDNKDNSDKDKSDDKETATELNKAVLLPDFKVDYTGHKVYDVYPDETATYQVKKSGYKVLALNFNVTNPSSESKNIDLIGAADFVATINDAINLNGIYSVNTFNALNMYEGTIGGGETVETVLLFYIKPDDATDINSIDLKVTDSSKNSVKVTLE